jgi:hypothetical protein
MPRPRAPFGTKGSGSLAGRRSPPRIQGQMVGPSEMGDPEQNGPDQANEQPQ